MTRSRTWFITGTSRGFGREWAKAALARGDRVVGTVRDLATVQDLLEQHADGFVALTLDVTDRVACFEAVQQAQAHFGELDIVVNNAGYGQFGALEEITEQELRDQFDTNFFGAIWVTQAALPFLRAQGHGHIIQVSSIGGITAFPTVGAYHASKWALEGFSQSLAQEIADFGIRVTLVEPGGFSTDWAGPSARGASRISAYDAAYERNAQRRKTTAPGDPAASAAALMKIVDAEQPPLRCFFGERPLAIAEADYAARLQTWREWQPVAELAQG